MYYQEQIETIKISDYIYLNEDESLSKNEAINLIVKNPNKYVLKYYMHNGAISVLTILKKENFNKRSVTYV